MKRLFGVSVLFAVVLLGCGEDEGAGEVAKVDSTQVDPTQVEERPEEPVIYDSAALTPEVWLADRYGAEQGTIELELSTEGEVTRQVRYFRDHGRTESLYYYATGPDNSPFVSVLKDDILRFRGVADKEVQEVPWSPELPVSMPNFRNLNDAMRKKYDLETIESREYLGREAEGYVLKSGVTTSKIWVWEGILLYGEVGAAPAQGIEPMVVRATSIDIESPVSDDKFVLK